MKRILFSLLIFTISTSSVFAQADFRLIDSLITAGVFPMVPSQLVDTADVVHDNGSLIYSYKPLNVNYFAGKGPYHFTYPFFFKTLTGRINTFIPRIHVALNYPYTHFYQGEKFASFGFEQTIKNFGDTTDWHMEDVRAKLTILNSTNDTVLHRNFDWQPPSKSTEGFHDMIIHQIGYNKKESVITWSPSSPAVYSYVIEVSARNKAPYEFFHGKVGIRSVRMRNDKFILNGSEASLKAAHFQINSSKKEKITERLRQLKLNNFNTIILSQLATQELLDWCDANGLYVVQNLSDSSFSSLDVMLQYFVDTKDHPSLILWNDTGLHTGLLNILKRLDVYRPIATNFKSFQFFEADWFALNPEEQFKIKQDLQCFEFYYIPGTSLLTVSQKEKFRFHDRLNVHWNISDTTKVIRSGIQRVPDFNNKKTEVKLPEEVQSLIGGEYSYTFELALDRDSYPYLKGDVVGMSKFSFHMQNGKLSYSRDY